MKLKHCRIFDNQGNHGVVGYGREGEDEREVVFKIPKHMNYVIQNEKIVMEDLARLEDVCPHFCKIYGCEKTEVSPYFSKEEDPFRKHDRMYWLDTLVMEYIPNSISLYQLIEQGDIPVFFIVSVLKQVLCAVRLAQRECRFTHYDLHAANILLKECPANQVNVYRITKDKVIHIPTYGWIPVIIDFGFSRSDGIYNQYMFGNTQYTQTGHLYPLFDPLADVKVLLVNLYAELEEYRKGEDAEQLKTIIQNLLSPLELQWDSGWDVVQDDSIMDQVFDFLHQTEDEDEHRYECFDILQGIVRLPLQKTHYSRRTLYLSYHTFLEEYEKIEGLLSSNRVSKYILRSLLDIAQECWDDYLVPEKRGGVVQLFSERVFERISSVEKFVSVETVDWELMLCSLYAFSEQFGGWMHELYLERMGEKWEAYSKLPFGSIDDVIMVLDMHYPCRTEYTKDHAFILYDYVEMERKEFSITDPDHLQKINSMDKNTRGIALHKLAQ